MPVSETEFIPSYLLLYKTELWQFYKVPEVTFTSVKFYLVSLVIKRCSFSQLPIKTLAKTLFKKPKSANHAGRI